jgi:cold shock protein
MTVGTVMWFNADKGYGFIQLWRLSTTGPIPPRPYESGELVFVHFSDIQMSGYRSLDEGQIVEFDVAQDDSNGPRAKFVRPVRGNW